MAKLFGDRPMLVGEMNPYGSDPQFALVPYPDGCSGHRLCHLILGMTEDDYVESFTRINLCEGGWDYTTARMAAAQVRASRIICLGAKVAAAFWLKYLPFEVRAISHEIMVLMLPHPSGLCRAWNDAANIVRARQAVRAFAPNLMEKICVT